MQRPASTMFSQVGYTTQTKQKSCISYVTQAPLPKCTAWKFAPSHCWFALPTWHFFMASDIALVVLVQQQQHLGQLATGPPQQPCMWMWLCQRSSSRSPGPTSTRCPSLRRQLTSRRWCACGWTDACHLGQASTHPSSSIRSSGKDRSARISK